MSSHRPWHEPMRLALAEARAALATDDVPVGAVVLAPAGDLIGTRSQRPGGRARPHRPCRGRRPPAAAAAPGEWRLTGCTLVVTLEPCTMCAGAAVLARVDRLVFGAYDDKAGAVGSLWDVVRDRGSTTGPRSSPECWPPSRPSCSTGSSRVTGLGGLR